MSYSWGAHGLQLLDWLITKNRRIDLSISLHCIVSFWYLRVWCDRSHCILIPLVVLQFQIKLTCSSRSSLLYESSQEMTSIFILFYYLWDRSLSILLYSSVCEIVRDQDWSHSLWSVLGCKSSQWGWSQEMRQMKRIICYSSTSTFENDLSLS